MTKKQIKSLIKKLPAFKRGDFSFPYHDGQRAIYFLFRGKSLIYIGKSKQLGGRLTSHAHKEYTHFRYFVIRNPAYGLVGSIENFLIDALRPRLNWLPGWDASPQFIFHINKYLGIQKKAKK